MKSRLYYDLGSGSNISKNKFNRPLVFTWDIAKLKHMGHILKKVNKGAFAVQYGLGTFLAPYFAVRFGQNHHGTAP